MARLTAWRGWSRPLGLVVLLLTVGGAGLLGQGGLVSATPAAEVGPSVNAADFPSIQAALDSLQATGGTVRIASGVQLLPAKLRVYSNVTVAGAGLDRTILKFAPGIEDHMVSNSSLSKGNSNIVIRDLSLLGQKTSKADCCFGLRLVNVRDSLVLNVASDGFSRDGFYLGYFQQSGVYNTRLSGCRASNNGRNGISLIHGSGNIIDNCQVDDNNRTERVAGIDLEPDEGLAVTGNKVVGNRTNGQNVGIQLYSFDRPLAVIRDNAICRNTAKNNRSAGIWENNASSDVFVDNVTSGNGTNILVDKSAKLGSTFASACSLPALPGSTPTATPSPSPSPSPTATVRATSTPAANRLSTASHSLSVGEVSRSGAQITARVEVANAGAPAGKGARVTIVLTRPNGGVATGRATTDRAGVASLRYKVSEGGEYRAVVTGIELRGTSFQSGARDTAAPVTVTLLKKAVRGN